MDSIKIDLGELRWSGFYWIVLTHDRVQSRALVNTVMNLEVPKYAGRFLSSRKTDTASREELSSLSYLVRPLVYTPLC
jgi:hypothetical protein